MGGEGGNGMEDGRGLEEVRKGGEGGNREWRREGD